MPAVPFVVDSEGVIRHVSVHDLAVGRNPEEVLRTLDALQSGGLCPVNWKRGEATLQAGRGAGAVCCRSVTGRAAGRPAGRAGRRPGRGLVALGLALGLFASPGAADPGEAPRDEAPVAGAGATLRGQVVAVGDGDTLTLLVDERPLRVRLAQIDAPERGQPWARRSRRALAELAFGREARVEVVDVDAYGRVVGEVYVGGRHVNAELVRRGHAWAYTRYARSLAVIELEKQARRAGVGLWALPEGQRDPPWLWRRGEERAGRRGPLDCDPGLRCADMRDCDEARARLERCGARQLDGDGDGVPCEALCAP